MPKFFHFYRMGDRRYLDGLRNIYQANAGPTNPIIGPAVRPSTVMNMRTVFFILLFLLRESLSAQPSSERLSQIPDWFLVPKENECVGVSFPSADPSERTVSALISALIAFEAQTQRSSTVNPLVTKDERIIQTPISYHIVRQFVNDNGELFIALQASHDGADSLQVSLSKESVYNVGADVAKWECTEMIEYMHAGVEYGFYRIETEHGVKGIIEMKQGERVAHFTLNDCRANYPNKRQSMLELSWQYTCEESLHAAYMRALCMFIVSGIKPQYPASIVNNKLIFHSNE